MTNSTDRYIFEALDYMYILGELDAYDDVVNLFNAYTGTGQTRKPIPNEMKQKMTAALRKRKVK